MRKTAIGTFFFGIFGFFMAISTISALEFQITSISNHVGREFIVALLSLSLVSFILAFIIRETEDITKTPKYTTPLCDQVRS